MLVRKRIRVCGVVQGVGFMDVDADPLRPTGHPHREVRALRADVAEGGQEHEVTRKLAAEFVDRAPRDLPDLRRLRLVKAARPDQRVDPRDGRLAIASGVGARSRRLIAAGKLTSSRVRIEMMHATSC